jgi:hypothetical protein
MLIYMLFCAGGSRGRLRVFDLQEGQEVAGYQAAADTVNGFHFHPFLPLAATASGKPRLRDLWIGDAA